MNATIYDFKSAPPLEVPRLEHLPTFFKNVRLDMTESKPPYSYVIYYTTSAGITHRVMIHPGNPELDICDCLHSVNRLNPRFGDADDLMAVRPDKHIPICRRILGRLKSKLEKDKDIVIGGSDFDFSALAENWKYIYGKDAELEYICGIIINLALSNGGMVTVDDLHLCQIYPPAEICPHCKQKIRRAHIFGVAMEQLRLAGILEAVVEDGKVKRVRSTIKNCHATRVQWKLVKGGC